MSEVLRGTGARLLGVGLAAGLAAVTVALWLTGQLGLYINPDSTWFAVTMAIVVLAGSAASFALPRGAEADHGHDHGVAAGTGHDDAATGRDAATGHDHATAGHDHIAAAHPAQSLAIGADQRDSRRMNAARDAASGANHAHRGRKARYATDESADQPAAPRAGGRAARVAGAGGGILATAIVAAIVLTPPATLSAELAMQRDTGAAPLFQGADTVALAITGDTASFGVGEWASVFATATNPEAFEGTEITLTGFVTPDDAGFLLTRLVITHCVIDAQPASVPIAVGDLAGTAELATGTWVTVSGTIRDADGGLRVQASSIEVVDQPKDPYEY
ncbi:MAG: DUF1980 domain-containing protein [Microbacterium sp.]